MRGKLLGARYHIVEIIATGGFSQTYVAEDTHRPGSPRCVVKHLKPNGTNSSFLQNARRLFQSEAETLEKLGNHDQIPRLLAYFEENQEFYLVQDFIEGYPLSAELQPGHRWTQSQVCQLLQEVLIVLEFVHGYGVIHRDIKPSNLIKRQQDNKLVLVDFGSVKQAWTQVITAAGQTNTSFAVTIPATIAIGTPGYMPTEQGLGRPRPNSDIYALGIVGIQALTGLNPTQLLEDSDTGEILWHHKAQVSDDLAAILTKMVRYHFKDRYQTATEVLQALQPLVEQPADSQSINSQEITYSAIATHEAVQSSYRPQWQEPLPDPNIVLIPAVNKLDSSVSQPSSTYTAIYSEPLLPSANSIGNISQAAITSPVEPSLSSDHHNQGINVELNSLPEVAQENKNSQHRPLRRKQYHLWFGASMTALAIALVAGYSLYWQPKAILSKTLEQIETLKTQGKYQECISQAQKVPQNSGFYPHAQTLAYECQLTEATKLAAGNNFQAAIALAGKIPKQTFFYQDAQQSISQWSNSILEIATNKYNAGNLNEAIAIAKGIPENSPTHKKAQETTQQWNKEWQKNNSYLQAAQTALAQGKWQSAITEAKKVNNTAYWQEKIKPIVQKAEANSGASPTPATQPKRTATKTAVRSTPKRVTPTLTRAPVRTTPRRVTRAPTRRVTTTRRSPVRTTPRRVTRTAPKVPRAAIRPVRTTPRRVTRTAPRKPAYTWTTETVP